MTKQFSPSRLTSRLIRTIGDRIAPRGKGDGRLCILNYHRVLQSADPLLESEPDIHAFHWQMELLSDCFNVMPLYEAIECLAKERMPPRAVCISFDDGYRSVHDFALPILKKFGLPATVFVTTGYIDGGVMWNDRIIDAIQFLPSRQLDLRDIGLGIHYLEHVRDQRAAMNKLTNVSKYMRPKARDDLAQRLKELVGDNPANGLMLTREMISNLVNQGIEIGAHTITHPILTSLDDVSARDEILVSKQQLESITGRPTRLFAYPNGKFGVDFDDRHVQMAKDAGFLAAFTTSSGAATSKHDRFQLPRSRPWDSTPARFGFRLLRWLAG
jgi:peptidoglycan/xylan/chitin deacetylase (PgdA/CDA1 family)